MGLIDDQLRYYRARAGEYDEWFYRQGRYDRGRIANQWWHDETEIVHHALRSFQPTGDVLEIACGTGIWTKQLAKIARSVTALDAAPEMLKINEARCNLYDIEYIETDIFAWTPNRPFDVVFFSFWLSHVPQEKFESFWNTVRAALKPTGRVFLIDSLPDPDSGAKNHAVAKKSSLTQVRYLNDGQEFQIIKRYYQPDQLTNSLRLLDWTAKIETSGRFFMYGTVIPI